MGIAECQASSCKLRFPAESEVFCPICKGPTDYLPLPIVADQVRASSKPRAPRRDLSILVDNVRSLFNVGSIFRSADGVGISHVYIAGISPNPSHPKMRKTSLGAEEFVSWSVHPNALDLAQELSKTRSLWALETGAASENLYDLAGEAIPDELILVVGHEVIGVDPEVLACCQKRVHLPMQGEKISLNVATATGIAAYQLAHAR